ncbi:5'/3'-nucleotidase SurE [Yoonia sediminilitoris]|uniref:5'-nucleotidase SurE n=1 Tax=Yoonia sediminilitoris TaxID=1286148 RepID=A0A2T6KDZ9_9RHOB|nr:5'/3'-nucleotidase SurE [Yoonia sediminilitoris]PUB13256.1 5'-nucleotidase /3'-nucleotidase /exopolyphosphatase [Yoonia sediminilitoris]RCW94591.1 5'-nucleotidase /3'-nucleotidase /exopolyphosphatase [Yoonia sediminilitoris]
MRILITNDDGIAAPGLKVLQRIAQEIAGDDGGVWTVAPAFEQSGVGHCINYTRPTMIAQLDERRFAAEGSPADCIMAGLYDVMPDGPPDLILSGVNKGNNAAENTLYSGTIGAAIEGALQGVKSIALSQFFGPDNNTLENPFEAAVEHGASTVRALMHDDLWDTANYMPFYNVNFPPVPAARVKGIAATTQGFRLNTRFRAEAQTSPTGRRFLWVRGGPQHEPTDPGTDAAANLDGYISITPMRADLTDYDMVATLEDTLG